MMKIGVISMKDRKEKDVDSARFFRVYHNLPLMERSGVVCVINGEPMSWKVVNIEVRGKTEIGQRAINKMARMKII